MFIHTHAWSSLCLSNFVIVLFKVYLHCMLELVFLGSFSEYGDTLHVIFNRFNLKKFIWISIERENMLCFIQKYCDNFFEKVSKVIEAIRLNQYAVW